MNKNLKKKKKGFTLVEVIIVLAIIAVIAAIAVPNLTQVRKDSKKKADIQTCETIKRTIDTLVMDETIDYKAVGGTIKIEAGKQPVLSESMALNTAVTSIQDYFSGVKDPQMDTASYYLVTIASDGSVTNVQVMDSNNKELVSIK